MFKVDNKDNIFHKHFSHLLLVFLLLEQVNAGWVMKKKKKIGTQIYRKKNEEVSLDKDTG